MEPIRPSQGSSPYPISQLENNVEVVDLQTQNARLRAQLQQLQRDALERDNQELLRQIQEFRPNTTVPLPERAQASNSVPSQASTSQPPTPVINSTSAILPLADPQWTDFAFDRYDLPPTEPIYSSKADALAALNQWGLPKGYGFSTGSGTRPKKSYFSCDRRYPKPTEAEIKEQGEGKNKSSRGTNCPFSVACIQINQGWKLEYRKPWKDGDNAKINYCIHNHAPGSGTGMEIPAQRREQRKGEKSEAILKQFNSGAQPRKILRYLDKNFEGTDRTVAYDIYNNIRRIRRDRMQGLSTIETLLVEIRKKEWICRPVYDDQDPDRLLSVFFAYPLAVEYARIYSKVIIIDHTYNTNSAEMPLFEAIGIDATGKSFCICFEFTAGEDQEDCIQSLEFLKEMLGYDLSPGVFLIDKAEAMRNAIERVFPE